MQWPNYLNKPRTTVRKITMTTEIQAKQPMTIPQSFRDVVVDCGKKHGCSINHTQHGVTIHFPVEKSGVRDQRQLPPYVATFKFELFEVI